VIPSSPASSIGCSRSLLDVERPGSYPVAAWVNVDWVDVREVATPAERSSTHRAFRLSERPIEHDFSRTFREPAGSRGPPGRAPRIASLALTITESPLSPLARSRLSSRASSARCARLRRRATRRVPKARKPESSCTPWRELECRFGVRSAPLRQAPPESGLLPKSGLRRDRVTRTVSTCCCAPKSAACRPSFRKRRSRAALSSSARGFLAQSRRSTPAMLARRRGF